MWRGCEDDVLDGVDKVVSQLLSLNIMEGYR